MRDPVIVPPRPISVPVDSGGGSFPVNRIFCVGRNYAAHAREMGANPDREPPFFFMKPADTLLAGREVAMDYPPRTADLHHEVELVLALGAGGRDIAVGRALDLIWGAAVGLDMTRRDLQGAAKAAGRPWDMGKGFDGSAIVGALRPFSGAGVPMSGPISLTVNGTQRQRGDLSDMIWPVGEIIAELSSYLTLRAGDLIFTGTPEGVGPVRPGDVMEARCTALAPLTVRVMPRP